MSWSCYILFSNGKSYTGASNNVNKRLRQHNGELAGGAKATQMNRLLKRPNMSQDKIDVLLDRQNRDLHLMKKYDFSINSEKEFNLMKKDVISVIRIIREKINA